MAGFQQVIICGHLGADPEVRYTADGTAITSLSVATSEQWTDKQSGERRELTEWHRCTAFGRLAEIMGEYLRKGSPVLITGTLRTEEYEKDGIKRYATKIRVREMKMLGGKEDGGQRSERQKPAQQRQAPPSDDSFTDDDIPF